MSVDNFLGGTCRVKHVGLFIEHISALKNQKRTSPEKSATRHLPGCTLVVATACVVFRSGVRGLPLVASAAALHITAHRRKLPLQPLPRRALRAVSCSLTVFLYPFF